MVGASLSPLCGAETVIPQVKILGPFAHGMLMVLLSSSLIFTQESPQKYMQNQLTDLEKWFCVYRIKINGSNSQYVSFTVR